MTTQAQQTQASFRKGFVAGEFLTQTYRFTGEVALRGEPLLDQLNNRSTLFVTLERMFVSPLQDPAAVLSSYPSGELRKERISLVALTQARDGLPRLEGRYTAQELVQRQVLAIAAGFEITGTLRLHPTVIPAQHLRTTPELFIPLFDARAVWSQRRECVFKGGAILVNRGQVEVFAVLEDKDADKG